MARHNRGNGWSLSRSRHGGEEQADIQVSELQFLLTGI